MKLIAMWVVLAIAAVGVGAEPHPWLPQELAKQEPEAWAKTIESKLESLMGSEFPNWELHDKRGRRNLLDIVSEPTAVLYFGGPCPYAFEEIDRLSSAGWQTPDGKLVVVLKNEGAYREKSVRKKLRRRPNVYYLANHALEGIEKYLRIHPTYLVLDVDSNLVGYRVGGGDWHRAGNGSSSSEAVP